MNEKDTKPREAPQQHPLVQRVIETAKLSDYAYGDSLAEELTSGRHPKDTCIGGKMDQCCAWLNSKRGKDLQLSGFLDNLGYAALLEALMMLYVLVGNEVDTDAFDKKIRLATAYFTAGKLVNVLL